MSSSRALFRASALLLGLLVAAAPASAAIITVGRTNCTRTTIQDAINRAKQLGGHNFIHISRDVAGGTWTNQNIVIEDVDLTLVGGFDDCSDTEPSGRTYISGEGGRAAPVFRIRRSGEVLMYGLHIVGGDADSSGDDGFTNEGGGIDYRSDGTLLLDYTAVEYNYGVTGGGVHFESVAAGPAHLVLGNTVSIGQNEARLSGGGLYVRGATSDAKARVTTGASIYIGLNRAPAGSGGGMYVVGHSRLEMYGTDSAIYQNTARDTGGGVYVGSPAQVLLGATGPSAVNGLLVENSADKGGAIYLETAALTAGQVQLFATYFGQPTVRNNSAATSGGAFHVQGLPGTTVLFCARHITAERNFARAGSVAATQGNGARFSLNRIDEPCSGGYPSFVPQYCEQASGCSRITVNGIDANGNPAPNMYSVFAVDAGRLQLDKAYIYDNAADGVVRAFNGATEIWNSLIARNFLGSGGIVFDTTGSETSLHSVTIADNTINGSAVIQLARQGGFSMERSIVDQPGWALYAANAADTGPISFRDTLARVSSGAAGTPGVFAGTPLFVQSSPLDYRQDRFSPGVDFAARYDRWDEDIEGRPRGIDTANIVNFQGPDDLGAFEFQSASVPPVADDIFRNGFE